MGRRWVAIIGAAFIVLGMIISSTAHSMNVFICEYVVSGTNDSANECLQVA